MGPQAQEPSVFGRGVSVEPLKVGGSGVLTFQREHPQDMPEHWRQELNSHGIAGLAQPSAGSGKPGQNRSEKESSS